MYYLPKLLLIDMTSMEGSAATSSLKRVFFGDWPEGGFLHVRSGGHGHVLMTARDGNEIRLSPDAQSARRVIEVFKPEVILYRPVADHVSLHQCAMQLIACSDVPLVIWMMDDWPERLHADAPDRAAALDADLKNLFERSALNLAISKGMSTVFAARYGVSFEVAHNGIDPADWPSRLSEKIDSEAPLRLRYAGSLAPDTTRDSVLDVAKTVSRLAERGEKIRFEGQTQAHWYNQCENEFNQLPHVSLRTSSLNEQSYRNWLTEADIVLLAYNFDEATRRYLQYSFANKMPELLASGAALLAYGPPQLETLGYLERHGLGAYTSKQGAPVLEATLRRLIWDPDLRRSLGMAAREHAFAEFELGQSKKRLRDLINGLLKDRQPRIQHVFPRDQKMRLNECQLVHDVLGASDRPGIMIDVGAHLGSSLMPFAKSGWTVLAFEPDPVNREALIADVTEYPDVHISEYAVGREVMNDVPFYRSDISSGISSLTAFHESHKPGGSVSVTTLDSVIAKAGLTEIGFLKIDVEGHEMDILDGFDLTDLRPRAIMLEFEDGKATDDRSSVTALANRLLRYGYNVYVSEWHKVVQYGQAHDWRQFSPYPASLAQDSWGNLIAFKERPTDDVLGIAIDLNLSGTATGASALQTLVELAPKATHRRTLLTWIAVNVPWIRTLWRKWKALLRN